MTGITAPKKSEEAPKGADPKSKVDDPKSKQEDAPKTEAPKPPVPVQAAPKFAHTVAPGHAVTSKKGILKAGSEIRAEWLGGGDESLKRLVSKKIVIKA